MHWRVWSHLLAHKFGPGRPGLASINQNLRNESKGRWVVQRPFQHYIYGLSACDSVCTWEIRKESRVGVEAIFQQPLLCILYGGSWAQLLQKKKTETRGVNILPHLDATFTFPHWFSHTILFSSKCLNNDGIQHLRLRDPKVMLWSRLFCLTNTWLKQVHSSNSQKTFWSTGVTNNINDGSH